VLVDRNEFAAARKLLAEALKLYAGEGTAVQSEAGRFNYWLGYCLWKLGDTVEAEKHLRVARDLLTVQHPLDAEAAWAIGRIRQDAEDHPQAEAFYNAVLQSHLGSRAASVAKLGRGVSRIARGDHEAGLGDLTDAVRWLRERPRPAAKLVEETIAALKAGSEFLASAGNLSGALELMTLEQDLRGKPDREFFGRLARVYERRANQLQALVGDGKPAERAEREAKVREMRARAGDGWVAYSRSMVLSDDKGFGEAMWKGIELYETCGDVGRVISALETFVNERPEDPLAADAMLKLGNSYHAAGLFDKAIGSYKRCAGLYPRSLAASKSGVALARAYVAKGPDTYGKAEAVLRSVIDDNPQITPDAVEFREALAELANLHHRNGQYELAIARLDEMTQRYPHDERMGQLLFLMGDCYRKSAAALELRMNAQRATAARQPTTRQFDLEQATVARRERLEKARDLFKQVIEHYKAAGPRGETDRLYQKLAHFYQADCVYDLGEYVDAIKCYDDAAFRYQDDPSALAAYVQIVNANVALGRLEEAKAANERAKWMLRRMPADVFTQKGGAGMGKEAWEKWLEWSTQAGLWK
jgi:TolA-binding protein